MPSTYEEEEFIEEDKASQQIFQQVKYKELKKIEMKSVRQAIPMLISEAEPRNIGD